MKKEFLAGVIHNISNYNIIILQLKPADHGCHIQPANGFDKNIIKCS